MKKNKMMRLASILLVVTLLSTSVISGTFAKYTTTNTAKDTARVAKWGVVITAQGNLYGKNYATSTESIPTTDTRAGNLSVMSSNDSKVLAPGTKSEHGLSFDLNGTPEVRTEVTVTASAQDIYLAAGSYAVMQEIPVDDVSFADLKTTGLYTTADEGLTYTLVDRSTGSYDKTATYYALTDFVKLAAAYYPVVYANTNAEATNANITEIAKKIVNLNGTAPDTDNTTAKASFTSTKVYDPRTNLASEIKLGANKISWAWAFEAEGANAKDTILGNIIAGAKVVKCTGDTVGAVSAVTVLTKAADEIVMAGSTEVGSVQTSFDITITATQVD